MHDLSAYHPAVAGCVEACNRCLEAARVVAAAGDGAYGEIGPHLRHCLDHFTCLFRGLENGAVDYDARDRSEIVETDPASFEAAMRGVIAQLGALDAARLPQPLQTWQIPAPDHAPLPSASTLERELLFLSGHTIHHLAAIVLIAKAHGIALPDALSVAFSTAMYRASLSKADP